MTIEGDYEGDYCANMIKECWVWHVSVSWPPLLFSLYFPFSHSQFPFLRPTKAKTEMALGGGRHGDAAGMGRSAWGRRRAARWRRSSRAWQTPKSNQFVIRIATTWLLSVIHVSIQKSFGKAAFTWTLFRERSCNSFFGWRWAGLEKGELCSE